MDDIYDAVDLLMTAEAWTFLDLVFASLVPSVEEIELDLLLTYATASFPGKSNLPKRKEFMDKCIKIHSDPSLWVGLE